MGFSAAYCTQVLVLLLTASSTYALTTAVDLGSAGNYALLAKALISNTGGSFVAGDVGLSPAALAAVTGFDYTLDPSGTFATSQRVSGQITAADIAPTPLSAAVSSMEAAYNSAAARGSDYTNEGAGNIGGLTLLPGVHTFSTGVTISSTLTLSGTCADVFVFQISETLTQAANVGIQLVGGVRPSQVFWQVTGATTIGVGASFQGIILAKTSVAFQTGANINGRILAQTAITLDSNGVQQPSDSGCSQTITITAPGSTFIRTSTALGIITTLTASGTTYTTTAPGSVVTLTESGSTIVSTAPGSVVTAPAQTRTVVQTVTREVVGPAIVVTSTTNGSSTTILQAGPTQTVYETISGAPGATVTLPGSTYTNVVYSTIVQGASTVVQTELVTRTAAPPAQQTITTTNFVVSTSIQDAQTTVLTLTETAPGAEASTETLILTETEFVTRSGPSGATTVVTSLMPTTRFVTRTAPAGAVVTRLVTRTLAPGTVFTTDAQPTTIVITSAGPASATTETVLRTIVEGGRTITTDIPVTQTLSASNITVSAMPTQGNGQGEGPGGGEGAGHDAGQGDGQGGGQGGDAGNGQGAGQGAGQGTGAGTGGSDARETIYLYRTVTVTEISTTTQCQPTTVFPAPTSAQATASPSGSASSSLPSGSSSGSDSASFPSGSASASGSVSSASASGPTASTSLNSSQAASSSAAACVESASAFALGQCMISAMATAQSVCVPQPSAFALAGRKLAPGPVAKRSSAGQRVGQSWAAWASAVAVLLGLLI